MKLPLVVCLREDRLALDGDEHVGERPRRARVGDGTGDGEVLGGSRARDEKDDDQRAVACHAAAVEQDMCQPASRDQPRQRRGWLPVARDERRISARDLDSRLSAIDSTLSK